MSRAKKFKISDIVGKLLFPQRCRFCDTVINIDEKICSRCINNKNEITGKICFQCGCKKEDCVCRGRKHYYKAVAAPYYYDGAAGYAVRNLKFKKIQSFADTLAEDMAACLSERFGECSFDFVTFVPMTAKAVKKRGFNQAKLLAEGVSAITGIPFSDMLVKNAETKEQHMLREYERSGNVLGVYDVRDSVIKSVNNARILICDDVKTTGSTLNECAKTLMIAGAAEVFCLTATIANVTPDDPTDEKEPILVKAKRF